ncbi:MAG TPA: hypothetical protein VII28_09655, partial [Puia sp.]
KLDNSVFRYLFILKIENQKYLVQRLLPIFNVTVLSFRNCFWSCQNLIKVMLQILSVVVS